MAPRDFSSRLIRRATRAGLFLTDDLTEQLSTFYALLSRWNEKINLTALQNPDEAIDRLILEPLMAARHVPVTARRLMDVGSGGGSPAVPLKLALPRLALTMVEVKARDGVVIAVVTEGDTEPGEIADHVIEIPRASDLISPILSIIPLQLLAYHIGVRRGCDVDQPRNLAKSVTVE